MNCYFSQPILPLIDATPEFTALLNSDVRKVGKYIARYARQMGQTAESLTLLDLCDERANLLPAFSQFVNSRPKPPDQSEQQYIKYGCQILSRVKKIIKVIAAGLPNIQDINGLPVDLLRSVPECLQPVLIYLPRANRRTAFSPARLASPITERARLALKAILTVVERNDITTLSDLFVTHWVDLRTACYAGSPPAEAHKIYGTLIHIRANFNLHQKKSNRAFQLQDAPPKLRAQIQQYLRLAPSGAMEEAQLREIAISNKMPLEQHEESTIASQVYSFLALLGRTELRDNMEISDFIRMDSRIIEVEGESIQQFYNSIIEPFRAAEQAKQRPTKARFFDSTLFRSCVLAVKSIAAYNGVFRYHAKFSAVYKPHLDLKNRDERRAARKEAFPMSWLDFNLNQLRPQFEAIIEEQSFKTDIAALELCMCYIYLMMLRYMGVRQQGVRICKIGWNVLFNADGSITFHWRKHEIKNDKDFTSTIKPRHTSTFAPLVKALRAYRRHIYPFLVEVARQAGVDLEGQLFLEVLADGQVRRFSKDIDGAKKFADTFKHLTSRFLDFTDIEPAMRRQFNAHHIRGIASDWLHNTLGVGTEGTAKFLANNRQTTERIYLDTSHIDSTPVLDEADARAMLLKTQRGKANTYADDAGDVGSIYEQQIAYLTTQNELLQTKVDQVSNLLEELTHQWGGPTT